MTRILGTLTSLVTLVALAGCGSAGSTGSAAPTGSAVPTSGSPSGSSGSPGTVVPASATVVPGPNATRGPREQVATSLPDKAAVTAYAARLAGSLPLRVRQAALPLLTKDGTLYAQAVFDGCGTPPVDSLTVTKSASGGVIISTDYRDPPNLDCLVGVRSVALVVLT